MAVLLPLVDFVNHAARAADANCALVRAPGNGPAQCNRPLKNKPAYTPFHPSFKRGVMVERPGHCPAGHPKSTNHPSRRTPGKYLSCELM